MSERSRTLPLGLYKQAAMKIDSAIQDLNEIREDEGISQEDMESATNMVELLGFVEAKIVNTVQREMDSEEFLSESIEMDPIDKFPGDSISENIDDDMLDIKIE